MVDNFPPIPPVEPPLALLWKELEAQFGRDVAVALKVQYAANNRRYERAARLAQFARDLKRRVRAEGSALGLNENRLAYRRYCLMHPEQYINGEIAEPVGLAPWTPPEE